jgi:hypothetical protein
LLCSPTTCPLFVLAGQSESFGPETSGTGSTAACWPLGQEAKAAGIYAFCGKGGPDSVCVPGVRAAGRSSIGANLPGSTQSSRDILGVPPSGGANLRLLGCGVDSDFVDHLPRSEDGRRIAPTGGFRWPLAVVLRLRLDGIGSGGQSMQPTSQHWIWMALVVLALTMITYLVVPPAVIKQATALLIWG